MLRIPHGRLIALRAPSPIDPNAEPPQRLLFLKWGDNATTKGNFRVGSKSLASLAANQRALGFEEVVVDFEHNTVPGHPSNKGEPAAIAARGLPKVVENEGLYLESLSWTEAGNKNREHYRDLSPTVAVDENGEVIFIHSGALCRNGATFDLHAFNAGIDFKTLNVVVYDDGKVTPQVSATSVDLDRLRKVLSLSADATVEDINRALFALDGLSNDGNATLSADVMAQLRALSAKINGFESRFADAERESIVLQALSAGKVIPKQFLDGELKLDNARLKALVTTLPEIVPLDARTPERLADFTSQLQPANPVRKLICDQLEISEDSLKKYGGTALVTT